MISYKEYLGISEQIESKSVVKLLKDNGYGKRAVGAEDHVTYTNLSDTTDQFLIDVGGKEWHHMIKGKVIQKGSTKDD